MILKLSLTVLLLYYLAVLWKYYRQDIAGMFGTAETDEDTDEPTDAWCEYCAGLSQKMPVIEIDLGELGNDVNIDDLLDRATRHGGRRGGLLRHRAGGGRGGDGL